MLSSRRQFLVRGSAAFATVALAPPLAVADTSPAVAALDRSSLIYLTPVVSGGRESKCHGEVWFVRHAGDVFVSTRTDAWRSEAIRRGFTRTKIWIGEFGVWTRADDKYRSAPYLELEGRIEQDREVHGAVLEVFGKKYAAEWGKWGPRFHDGLADGSRVMLRYSIVG